MSKAQKGIGRFLDTYKAKRPGSKCWLCGIPEREEIDKERRERGPQGCPTMAVVGYLRGIYGDMVGRSRVGNHFAERHHER